MRERSSSSESKKEQDQTSVKSENNKEEQKKKQSQTRTEILITWSFENYGFHGLGKLWCRVTFSYHWFSLVLSDTKNQDVQLIKNTWTAALVKH